MTLNEFITLARKELDSFEQSWREQQRGPGGNLFPDRMDLEEWYEHFAFWMDGERNGPQV